MHLLRCFSEGQTILHQVADQARSDPFTRFTVKDEKTKEDVDIISLADGRENELKLTGAKLGRAKVSLWFFIKAVSNMSQT